MARYHVAVRGIEVGHEIPSLLLELGDLLMTQERGALGQFDALGVSPLSDGWSKEPEKLRAAGFGFLQLGDGSVLALLRVNGVVPVVLLDSEGVTSQTVADSFEQFLHAWSKGETGVGDLDDDEAKSGRKELATWLKRKKVKAPKDAAPRFDFQAWLDTGNGLSEPQPTTGPRRVPTGALPQLNPRLRALAAIVGLPANAPELLALASEIGVKVPPTTSSTEPSKSSPSKKTGLTFAFTHQLLNDSYPPITKTAKSFVPYLREVRVGKGFKDDVLGVPWKGSAEEIEKVLGAPTSRREAYYVNDDLTVPVWSWQLDEAAQVWFEVAWNGELEVRLKVASTRMLGELWPHRTSLFISWALQRGLNDETRFAKHSALIAGIKARQAHGAALLAEALPRGLWEDHLIADRLLRNFTYRWFHNIMGHGNYIVADLIKALGSRVGPHGHDEPVLDEDSWETVDRATPVLDERFAAWVKT